MRNKIRVLLMTVLLLILTGCGVFMSRENVVKAVEKQGYTNVQILEKHIFFVDWHGCGSDDDAIFNATATNPTGKQVDILICAGWPFKAVTVRTK